MKSGLIFCFFGLLFLGLATGKVVSCSFPAVYNFGDSNSDTGGRSAAFVEVPPPYGETFFKKPSGRLSDGRLLIDFIAEALGIPYLSPYLDSIQRNFEHGANFATGGSSIEFGSFSPFNLGIQLSQFIQFKSRTNSLYMNQHNSDGLPNPDDFSKALYTFDIGQNDLTFAFQNLAGEEILEIIPQTMNQFAQVVRQLYDEGARYFWVHNTGPIGCLPMTAIPFQFQNGTLDENGCAELLNNVAQEFNRQLKDRVTQLRTLYPQASFTFVDIYSAKLSLISNAKSLGFDDPLKFCCGSLYPYPLFCGFTKEVNGTVYGGACADPESRISWDGIHYTEAANKWVAAQIISGSICDPPIPITETCSF